MVPTTLGSRHIWRCQQSVHLRLFQVRDLDMRSLLERYRSNLTAPFDQLRCVLADEARQSVDGGQPLIARGDRAFPLLLQLVEKLPHAVGRHVGYGQAIDRFAGATGDSREQQPQSITVAPLRVPGEVSLADQVFHQESSNPWA